MQHIYLKNKSYSVEALPSEPRLLVEILDLCHNDNANFEMFSTAIEKDISLTAKILQVANSPAYRQWNTVTDIRRMLIILGLTNVRNIVITCAIQQFFNKFTKSFNNNIQMIWLRSLVCANLAERIAKLIGYDKPGEAFLAGLLHQVGMLLLLMNQGAEYQTVLDCYYQETDNFCFLEREKMHVDHCDLGGALVESWELDSFIADAIHFQHAPAEELLSSPILLKILAVASPLSSKNSARKNRNYLEKAGLLFGMTEDTILNSLNLAVEKSKRMIIDLGFSGRFYMEENEEQLFDAERQEKTQLELQERIKDLALSSTIGKSDKVELVGFAKEARACFNSIFNLNQLFFLKMDDNRKLLTAINDLKIHQLDEIEFRAEDKNSLLVKAFIEKKCLASLSERCSIADQQIIRLLGADGAYFIPIYHNGIGLGILAVGINEKEWPAMQSRTSLFKLMSNEIARKYFSLRQDPSQPVGMTLVDFGKIAHEVSNPLTIINNYLYMLGKKIESEHPAQEEIKFISEEIERVGNILLRAKDPESHTKTKPKRIELNKLITELDTLFNSSLYKTKQIESTLHLDKDIPAIYCPQDKLKQILINIIKNAVEALQDKGTIVITSRGNYYQNDQQYVEVSIQDNGPGIDPEILKNLFKPVSSKKPGHSGLGLSIVNTLIKEISGNISCHSRQNHGTEFKILIPRILEQNGIEPE